MLAALTALFSALAAAANAYTASLKWRHYDTWLSYMRDIDALEREIYELRAQGGIDATNRADSLRLRIEQLYSRVERLPAPDTDD